MSDYRSGHFQHGKSVGRQQLPLGARLLIVGIALAILSVAAFTIYQLMQPKDNTAALEGERAAFVASCTLTTATNAQNLKDDAKVYITGTVVENKLMSPCNNLRTGIIVHDTSGKWFVCCANTENVQVGDYYSIYGTYNGTESKSKLPWLKLRYVRGS